MGCEQSKLPVCIQRVDEIQEERVKSLGRKKNKNQKINGRISFIEIFQNIKSIDLPKTNTDLELIENTISKHFLLFKLSKNQRKQVAKVMEAYQTQVGQYVFKQGTPASMFFIINQGAVQIQINGIPGKIMRRGDFFGELAIIYSAPRSASVKVLQKCSFWCLKQQQFLLIQREMVKNNYKISKPYVYKLPLFNFLTNKQRDSISYNMNTLKYEQNDIIFETGDDAISFFVILQGVVSIGIPGKPPLILKNGDSFGQNCLKSLQKRSGTATCLYKTQLLAISRQDLKNCLGFKSEEQLLLHNTIKWALRRSKNFINLNFHQQQKIIELGKIVFKNDGEIIVNQGQNDQNIYIPLEQKINDFEVGVIINQNELQDQRGDLFISKHTLTKIGNGYIFIISLRNVDAIFIKEVKTKTVQTIKIEDQIGKNDHKQAKAVPATAKIEFKDLFIISKLGEGQMGKVFLVQNKKTSQKYALKCVEKNMVVKHQMQKFIRGQKQILQMCNFPLIVKLIQSYKDSHFIYFLLEYIEGGDFFDFLSELGICNNTTAKFYFGCLLLCIQYLHKKNIVYRDLKPQNAALDSNGYLHMIDLGTAKFLNEEIDAGHRTFTIIGTPHYMAPQVMQAKGYSFSVDVWSLGIILYEMVCGVLPFGGYSDDPVMIYQQIEKNQLKFPKNYTDPCGKELIRRLLQKHQDKRAVDDFSEIKNMEYFQKFNWKQLQAQKMTPPIHPKTLDPNTKIRTQYLMSYLKKQRQNMDRPLPSSNPKWDQIF